MLVSLGLRSGRFMMKTVLCKNTRGFGIKQSLTVIPAFTLISYMTEAVPFLITYKRGRTPILKGC